MIYNLTNLQLNVASVKHLIVLLIVLILIDIITGVINAILKKDLMSKKMKEGIVGKVYELCIVAISILLDKVFTLNCITYSVCIFYIVQEGMSILENTGEYISYPPIIKNIFEKLKGGNSNG